MPPPRARRRAADAAPRGRRPNPPQPGPGSHGGRRSFVAVRQTSRADWLVYESRDGKTHQQFGHFPNEESARRYADQLTEERQRHRDASIAPRDSSPPLADWYEAAGEVTTSEIDEDNHDN